MSLSTRPARLAPGQIWQTVARQSFAVLSHVTPSGSPRSSGVVYVVAGDRMYVAVAGNSWKARHIGADGLVAVTVPVRRGGLLSLAMPIPPATISFPAIATAHAGDMVGRVPGLARLLPGDRRRGSTVLEIRPIGHYVTYGVGVPLLAMRDPARARARVAVS
jgi:hypothetical protein